MTEGMVVASHSARALRRIAWRPRVSPLLRVHRLGDCRNCPSIGSRTFGPFLAAVDVFDLTPSVTDRALTLASPRRLSPLAAGPQTNGRSPEVMRGSPISPLAAWLKSARTGFREVVPRQ